MDSEARSPGSNEGLHEMQHWGFMNKALNGQERAWLIKQANAQLFTRPLTLADTLRWLNSSKRTVKDAVGICKRWGIDFPFIDQVDGKYATEVPKE